MSIIQIIDAFTFYGIDVLALAALTTVAVQILKKTLLKKCRKKVLTFLPFTLGIAFYAVYAGLYHFSLRYLVESYVEIVEHGFSVGALSTVFYVYYEQFVREKKRESVGEGVISTLIEGYVPSEETEQIAQKIAEALEKDVTGDGAKKAAAILCETRADGVDEKDMKMLARLIIETLAHVNSRA